jgi:hypothetical protein
VTSIFSRVLALVNAVVWAIVIWFPFVKFFSVPTMLFLSKALSLATILLAVSLLVWGVVLLVGLRKKSELRKTDLGLTLGSLLASSILFVAFSKGLL